MPEEVFTDELATIAMDVFEELREDIHTYVKVEREHISFACKSADKEAFIIQEVPDSARINSFILPYYAFEFSDHHFEYERDLSQSHTECKLCGSSSPNAEYLHKGHKCTLHKSCAEQYNNALCTLQTELEEYDKEIKSNILSTNV